MNRFKPLVALFALLTAISSISIPAKLADTHRIYALRQTVDADWVVVGAGPSGIATVGVLLDIGINPDRITWVDPEFNVGRIGAYYFHVPANSKVKEFIYFLTACQAFKDCSGPTLAYLRELNPDQRGQELSFIVEPLKCITDHLRTKINSVQDRLSGLNFANDVWQVGTQSGKTITTNHVVLATGCYPKTLEYETSKIIPLDYALDPQKLKTLITPDDVVGVVGSAHSAILLLKFLSEIPVKHIYNLYKTPPVYAIDMGDWTLNSFTGLSGVAADWAQKILENNPPANLTRIESTDESLKATLAQCTKVIYAIGFERNVLPEINGVTAITQYNETSGFIAPRLFGIGLAFPELISDHLGNQGHCIGLDCFMEYAQKQVPQWTQNELFKCPQDQAQAQLNTLKKLSELFTIYSL